MIGRRVFVLVALLALPLAGRAEDPPRRGDRGGDKVRLELREAPLKATLEALAACSGRKLVFEDEVPERLSLSFSEMATDDAFDQLLSLEGYRKQDLGGGRILVTHRPPDDVAPVPSAAPEGDATTLLYVLSRFHSDEAAKGIARATSAAVMVLPRDRELLVTTTPAGHALIRAWLENLDTARVESRTFALTNRHLTGENDPIARAVTRFLSVTGRLEVDTAQNALLVADEPAALERVATQVAAIDRAPLSLAIDVALVEVPAARPLPGFAPANDLPSAFGDSGAEAIEACFASQPGPLGPLVKPGPELAIVAQSLASSRCDERCETTVALADSPAPIHVAPRIVSNGIDLEVCAGARTTRVRTTNGRAVAIRGLVPSKDAAKELVLVVLASTDRLPERPTTERPRRELPDLAEPEDWLK